MKTLFFSLMLSILSLVGISQTYNVTISGVVTDINSGEGVVGHPIDIMSDSMPGDFFYYNTVLTDADGYFEDVIAVTSGTEGIFIVSTFSCNDYLMESAEFSETETEFEFDFAVCTDPGGGDCQAMFYYYPADSAGMLTVQFVDQSIGNPVTWDWNFGDGNSSTVQNPIHTYGAEGEYIVNLTISDDSGNCTSTIDMLIWIGYDSIPDDCQAMFYNYPGDAPNSMQFMDESWGNPTTWNWSFGDGNTSDEQNPLHIYGAEGEYLVNLTIHGGNGNCLSTIEMIILVGYDSIPNDCQAWFFSYPGDMPNSMQFMDESWGNPTNWSWNFGDGNTSDEQNPLHIYAAEGEYLVSLMISDDSLNCTSTYEEMVWVFNDTIWPPEGCQAQFFYYPAFDSVPAGDFGTQFIDVSFGNPISWDWDFGDGNTSTEQNPIHFYTEEGEYEVCLSIANPVDSCESTYCEMVFIYNDTIGDCFGWFEHTMNDLTVDFDGYLMNSQSGEYTWDFGDGTSGTGATVSHTYDDDGIYEVQMFVTDSAMGCSFEYVEMLWVGDDITFAISGNVFLADSMGMADVADVYLMTFDTIGNDLISVATTSIDANGYYEFEEVGLEHCIYFVQAELTSGSSYFGEYVPTYHFDALNWEMAWPVFPFPMGWSYDVYLQPSQSIQSGSGLITGTVNEEESRASMSNVEIILYNDMGVPITYLRTNENGEFDFPELAFGTYTVYAEIVGIETTPVTVTLNETGPEAQVNIVVANGEALLGIGEPSSKYINEVSGIYPNPVSENAAVDVEMKESGTLELTITNQYGQLVFAAEKQSSTGMNKIDLNTNSLSSGLYIVHIKANDDIATVRKFVKLR